MQELDFSRGIWTAAMDGDEQTVSRMLSEGTDPNIQDTSGYSPLVTLKKYINKLKMNFYLQLALC